MIQHSVELTVADIDRGGNLLPLAGICVPVVQSQQLCIDLGHIFCSIPDRHREGLEKFLNAAASLGVQLDVQHTTDPPKIFRRRRCRGQLHHQRCILADGARGNVDGCLKRAHCGG